jgi:hypothetical protein
MTFPTLLDTSDRLTDAVFFGDRQASGAAVPSTRTITAGFGLTGGGDLSANRSFKVNDLVNGFNVLNHGVVADGVTDNTAAYTTIFGLATRGTMMFPPGVYAGSLLLPDTGDTRLANWNVVGAGIAQTYLIPHLANTPVLSKGNRADGVIQGATFGGFTVKAHASGSTGTAIDLGGMRACEFSDIGYSSNAGGDYASLFHFSAGQMVCYGNKVDHVVIDGGTVGNTGPATVVLFDTKNDAGSPAGAYPGGAANDHELSGFFVYSNTGINTAFDCLAGVGVRVHDCFLESNSGCTYVIPGSGCVIFNNHFESGVTTDTILYSTGSFGTSNDTIVFGNEFSDLASLTFHSPCAGNLWFNNVNQSFATFASSDPSNVVWQGGKVLFGSLVSRHVGSIGDAPAVSSTNIGAGGTATLLTGSNDTDGIIELMFGTAPPASTGIITMIFAEAYLNSPSVMICPATGVADAYVWSTPAFGAQSLQVGAIATTQMQIRWALGSAPASGTNLRINYHVKGLPN